MSFKNELKNATNDGFPGGCLKACSGSGCSQYSSSHSAGKSMSILDKTIRRHQMVPHKRTLHPVLRMDGRELNCLFGPYIRDPFTPTSGTVRVVSKKCFHQKARFHNSSSTVLGLKIRLLRCAPTSWANRIPIPTIVQDAWGADEPCRNSVNS